jgi:hypothetical protein
MEHGEAIGQPNEIDDRTHRGEMQLVHAPQERILKAALTEHRSGGPGRIRGHNWRFRFAELDTNRDLG